MLFITAQLHSGLCDTWPHFISQHTLLIVEAMCFSSSLACKSSSKPTAKLDWPNCLHILMHIFMSSHRGASRFEPLHDYTSGLAMTVSSLPLHYFMQVGECVGTYWRPSFDANMYPYLPAHITKPKEVKRLFIVPLPERCYFAVRLL